MIIRKMTLITFAVLSLSTTGCTGMRQCFFGRGAGCGLCNRLGAVGSPINPFSKGSCLRGPAAPAAPGCGVPHPAVAAPAYIPQAAAPVYAAPPCTTPAHAAPGYVAGDCGCGGYSVGMPPAPGCHSCGDGVSHYGGDPYLNGNSYGAPVYGSPMMGPGYGDNFQPRTYQSRRVDAQGDVIIQEDPLPPGARIID